MLSYVPVRYGAHMPPKDRPNRPNTVQITFRVPTDMADWLRDRARDHARQPGAELMLLLRPAFEADMKQRAWLDAQRAQAQKAQDLDPKPGKRIRRKLPEEMIAEERDLFASLLPGLQEPAD